MALTYFRNASSHPPDIHIAYESVYDINDSKYADNPWMATDITSICGGGFSQDAVETVYIIQPSDKCCAACFGMNIVELD